MLRVACISAAVAAAAPWTPSRFVISFWVDPTVDPSQFQAEYARIAQANFTTLMGGFGATTPVEVQAQVAACAATGLACIPASCESPTGPNPGGSCIGAASPVFGYQMYDEPPASLFPALATWAASVAARAPGALRFINLLPNYGFPVPSHDVYTQYVTSYAATVQPDILCFDHYPQFYPGSESDDSSDVSMAGYHRNLAIIRTAALAGTNSSGGAPIPFYNFFGAMPYGGRADFTESQMRWQAFTSLAYGSKGLLYFCYWTPAGDTFNWANALLTPRALPGQPLSSAVYQPGAKYYQAQRINSKLVVYGTYLLPATSAFVFAANGTGTGNATVVTGNASVSSPIVAVGGSGAGGSWSVLLGGFTGVPAKTAAVLVHNQDPSYPLLLFITLAPGVTAYEVDPSTGAAAPALNDAPALPPSAPTVLYLYLEAGDARLLAF